jgi:ribose-phosphate pyrophosphokinase
MYEENYNPRLAGVTNGRNRKIFGKRKGFITPESLKRTSKDNIATERGRLLFAACSGAKPFARNVVRQYGILLSEVRSSDRLLFLEDIDYRFNDSETCVRLEHFVNGFDVFLFQSLFTSHTGYSVDESYAAALIASRALREHGANHVTAVFPYLAYARQDKPSAFEREPTTVRLMADLSQTAGIDRVVTWHPHSPQVHGFYGATPINILDPISVFADELKRFQKREDAIVVAPDTGALALASALAHRLDVDSAVAGKRRKGQNRVETKHMIGDFAGKRHALIVDDMLATGGSFHSLARRLVDSKGIEKITLVVSHNLCTYNALHRLIELNEEGYLEEVVVTDSIAQTGDFTRLPFLRVRSLADTFARVINRIHFSESVSAVFVP